jgi:hypothetical protein
VLDFTKPLLWNIQYISFQENNLAAIPETYSNFNNSEIAWLTHCGQIPNTVALQR